MIGGLRNAGPNNCNFKKKLLDLLTAFLLVVICTHQSKYLINAEGIACGKFSGRLNNNKNPATNPAIRRQPIPHDAAALVRICCLGSCLHETSMGNASYKNNNKNYI